MKIHCLVIVLSFIFCFLGVEVTAINNPSEIADYQVQQAVKQELSPFMQKYFFLRLNRDEHGRVRLDTVSYLYNQYIGQLDYLNHDSVPPRYIKSDPNFYKLFIPITYYRSAMGEYSNVDWHFDGIKTMKDPTPEILPFDTLQFTSFKRADEAVNKSLLALYVDHPEYVEKYEDQIMGYTVQYDYVTAEKETLKTPIIKLFQPEPIEERSRPEDPVLLVRKPNWWTSEGNGAIQLSQNYISENWHKGGESTNSLLGELKLLLKYDDKKKVQFENIFEGKVGFNTISSDSIRKYRINTDLLRLTSKLGIRAASNWYYTISAEFETQFFNNYKKNSTDKVSAFLAPANLSINLGMDYKYKNKKVDLSAIMSPGSYNMKYVGNKDVDETQFGLKKGDKFLHDIGSKVDIRFSWNIISTIRLDSRIYYFTNYERVEAEWENTIDFVLNRYLSTRLFVHARFDDGAKRVEGKSYFQLKELLSFGLNYRW